MTSFNSCNILFWINIPPFCSQLMTLLPAILHTNPASKGKFAGCRNLNSVICVSVPSWQSSPSFMFFLQLITSSMDISPLVPAQSYRTPPSQKHLAVFKAAQEDDKQQRLPAGHLFLQASLSLRSNVWLRLRSHNSTRRYFGLNLREAMKSEDMEWMKEINTREHTIQTYDG